MAVDVWMRLDDALEQSEGEWLAYIYRVDRNGHAVRPYLRKTSAWPGLLYMLRDDLNGGEFEILIRAGRSMKFAGRVSVIEGFGRR